MICEFKNNSSIFASVSRPKKLYLNSEVDFLCPFDNFNPQGYRAVLNPMLATSYSGSGFFGREIGRQNGLLYFINLQFHSTMTKEMKIAGSVKNSSA